MANGQWIAALRTQYYPGESYRIFCALSPQKGC
ncbi:hypothetical protein AZE42_05967 [Rhizopogon vesiculosus]|uniref:Uncharacterized protein n=1 Tax=Rhizopogon vesiculosus TaxID=180088 RepID=A0A1J8PSI9_9AGAM|nr:hypothetical protein AZE42_05967 [Rhizopogon vesiculosus]